MPLLLYLGIYMIHEIEKMNTLDYTFLSRWKKVM